MVVPGGGGWERWGVLSKLERPPWQFLWEAAGRVGVSCLNGRDPRGGPWGRRLGGLGVPVSLHVGGVAPAPPAQAPSPWPLCLACGWHGPCSPCSGPLALASRRGGLALVHLRVLVPVGPV